MEFNVHPTPADSWIDQEAQDKENPRATDEGRIFDSERPQLSTLLD